MTVLTGDISLDLVADYVRMELPEVFCTVEQTGGGCATIYLGWQYWVVDGVARTDGDPGAPFDQYDLLVPVLAGPGWFEGPCWTNGRCNFGDFSIGYDCNDPDPAIADHRGVGDFHLDPVEENTIAKIMVRLYLEHPRVKAGEIR